MYRLVLLGLVLALGCATGSGRGWSPPIQEDGAASTPVAEALISYSQGEMRLAETVRRIGEEVRPGIALMKGLEDRVVPPLTFEEQPFSLVVGQIAAAAGCQVQECGYYLFIYEPGYEVLTEIALEDDIGALYANASASMAFGADVPLYVVFKWLSHALGKTVVADNVVADGRVGELALGRAPLYALLEAALKSSRTVGFNVESCDEYVFVHSKAHKDPGKTLLNARPLSAESGALLERRVSVTLPMPPEGPAQIDPREGALQLGLILPSLSEQLGVSVAASRGIESFPVNPAEFNNVRLGTALTLLIRQWPLPVFGYEVREKGILIRRIGPSD